MGASKQALGAIGWPPAARVIMSFDVIKSVSCMDEGRPHRGTGSKRNKLHKYFIRIHDDPNALQLRYER